MFSRNQGVCWIPLQREPTVSEFENKIEPVLASTRSIVGPKSGDVNHDW